MRVADSYDWLLNVDYELLFSFFVIVFSFFVVDNCFNFVLSKHQPLS